MKNIKFTSTQKGFFLSCGVSKETVKLIEKERSYGLTALTKKEIADAVNDLQSGLSHKKALKYPIIERLLNITISNFTQ